MEPSHISFKNGLTLTHFFSDVEQVATGKRFYVKHFRLFSTSKSTFQLCHEGIPQTDLSVSTTFFNCGMLGHGYRKVRWLRVPVRRWSWHSKAARPGCGEGGAWPSSWRTDMVNWAHSG